MTSLTFKEILEILETDLTRTTIDCKKYDQTTITYTSCTLFTTTVNNETIYTNTRQIILYNDNDTIYLIPQSQHLNHTKISINTIETLEVT